MLPLLGVFVAGATAAVGAKVGTDVVYPWMKGRAIDLYNLATNSMDAPDVPTSFEDQVDKDGDGGSAG